MDVRVLTIEETGEAARVLRASFDERWPWLSGLLTPAEDRAFFRERLFRECRVYGAFEGDRLVGIIAFRA
jgi:putative acetyltransferase